jgi:hypothetical protein
MWRWPYSPSFTTKIQFFIIYSPHLFKVVLRRDLSSRGRGSEGFKLQNSTAPNLKTVFI